MVPLQSNSDDNDRLRERFRRLYFPVLEHPEDRPEQAPQRVRQIIYAVADRDQRDPINLFWDDEEEDDEAEANRTTINRHRPNDYDPDGLELDGSTRQGRHKKQRCFVVFGCMGVLWMFTILLLGGICGSGRCGSHEEKPINKSKGNNQAGVSFPQEMWTHPPSMAPSLRPTEPSVAVEPLENNNDYNESGGNIFLRPTTSFPLAMPPTSKPSDLSTNQTAINNVLMLQPSISPTIALISATNYSDDNTTSVTNSSMQNGSTVPAIIYDTVSNVINNGTAITNNTNSSSLESSLLLQNQTFKELASLAVTRHGSG